MGRSTETDLERAFTRYREAQAVLRYRAQPSLAEIDAALAARVDLFRCLVHTGWQPPEPVARQIDLDAVLVEQGGGDLGG